MEWADGPMAFPLAAAPVGACLSAHPSIPYLRIAANAGQVNREYTMNVVLQGCPPSLAALEGCWYAMPHNADSDGCSATEGGPVIPIGAGGLMFWPTGSYECRGQGLVAAIYSPKMGLRWALPTQNRVYTGTAYLIGC